MSNLLKTQNKKPVTRKVLLTIATDHLTTAEVRAAFLGPMTVVTRWGRNKHSEWVVEERTLDIIDAMVVK